MVRGNQSEVKLQVTNAYLSIDYGRQRQIIEYFGTISPNSYRTILSEALVVKAVDLSYLSGLVVTSDQCYSVGISDLWDRDRVRLVSATMYSQTDTDFLWTKLRIHTSLEIGI